MTAIIHPPRLEIAAHRTGRDFAIGLLTRQPDFDVIGLAGAEPHVAGAQHDGAEMQPEPLEHGFRACGHTLVFLNRGVRRGDGDEFHLGELVLAQHAARVTPRRSRLGPETCRLRNVAFRQFFFGNDLAGRHVCQRHFRCRNQPAAVGGAEQIIAELGQLVGAVGGRIIDHQRRIDFRVAVLAGVQVEHVLAKRALETRQSARQDGEPGARHFCRALEIHHPQRFAELEMFLCLETEIGLGA